MESIVCRMLNGIFLKMEWAQRLMYNAKYTVDVNNEVALGRSDQCDSEQSNGACCLRQSIFQWHKNTFSIGELLRSNFWLVTHHLYAIE